MAESLSPRSPFLSRPGPFWRCGVGLVVASFFFGIVSLGCGGGIPLPQMTGEGEGPGHREQRIVLSPSEELELGRKTYYEVLHNPEKYGPRLPDDSPEAERVRRVVKNLIRASEIEPLQREMNLVRKGYRYEWEVHVLQNKQVNAFALPGGKIIVFSGLLHVAQNDDQLAVVLGHEMGHVLAHHASERLAMNQISHERGNGFWAKRFDRAQESEADHIGIFLMTFAGYDPKEAIPFWKHMEQLTGGREPPEILSDHPSDEHRIRDLEQWIPKALAAKAAYDRGDIAPARRS
jgi:metalloendopeptidase OMA1, mitochondrial